jgi:hypothetical protein
MAALAGSIGVLLWEFPTLLGWVCGPRRIPTRTVPIHPLLDGFHLTYMGDTGRG